MRVKPPSAVGVERGFLPGFSHVRHLPRRLSTHTGTWMCTRNINASSGLCLSVLADRTASQLAKLLL